MTPVEEARVKPVGKVPLLTLNVYTPVPPLALIVWSYATLCVPLGSEPGDTVIDAQVAVMWYCKLPAQPTWSVAVTVKVNAPAAVGVPEITPAELIVRPVGKPLPTVKVYGVLLLPLAPSDSL
jgi:hypothetical protein